MNAATYHDIRNGASSFQKRVVESQKELFDVLGSKQSPNITFLTCSDSRIDPCSLTGTGAGDLFVIRNAGNIVPETDGSVSGELASLEFAVQVLKTEHIVVCGHSDCGAMKGLLKPEACAHLSQVSAWVRQAQGALVALDGVGDDPLAKLDDVIAANVHFQLRNLRKLEFVAEAESKGTLSLHGWVYDIGSGNVTMLEEGNG